MADDSKMMSGEFSDDQTVNISGNETADYESKVGELSEKIEALEKEKQQVVYENKIVNDRIEKMKESIVHLNSENEGLKREVEKLGSENKVLQAVAARASELEGEVSRLQHDLITTMTDLQEANGELLEMKAKVVKLENGETEKSIKMDAVVSERDLLIFKVENLVAKAAEKEKEVTVLESRIEELKVAVREKEELEKRMKELEGKVVVLEGKLDEKERVIKGLAAKQREVDGAVNGKAALVEEDVGSVVLEGSGKGNSLGGLTMEWPVVAVSTVSAVAVMGMVSYLHYARRR